MPLWYFSMTEATSSFLNMGLGYIISSYLIIIVEGSLWYEFFLLFLSLQAQ
jgi:hypothetical protein